jgi:hypothetical protein
MELIGLKPAIRATAISLGIEILAADYVVGSVFGPPQEKGWLIVSFLG